MKILDFSSDFFPKRWLSGCIKVNRDDMCRCVRVGGCGCMLGGRPWAASAGPPAAEIFPWFQILYPRSYPDPARYFFAESFICLKSMIGRFQTDEWSLWGRSSWKWLFYWRKTRCALIFSISTKKHAEIEFYVHFLNLYHTQELFCFPFS